MCDSTCFWLFFVVLLCCFIRIIMCWDAHCVVFIYFCMFPHVSLIVVLARHGCVLATVFVMMFQVVSLCRYLSWLSAVCSILFEFVCCMDCLFYDFHVFYFDMYRVYALLLVIMRDVSRYTVLCHDCFIMLLYDSLRLVNCCSLIVVLFSGCSRLFVMVRDVSD